MRTPTDSQWAAIRAYDHHTVVAAAAGTGKTSTVVGRILYLLGVEIRGEVCPAPLELRDIGAITYTNAAAADLKKKLRDELRAAGLREAAHEVDGARIGTIHAFAGDVLREFGLRLGRSPDTRIMDEGEAAMLAADAVHTAILDAVEHDAFEGLTELLSVWSVGDIEQWVGRLAGDGARLDRIAANRGTLGARERVVVDLALSARAGIERRLHDARAVDFDRMITWTRDLLARDALARRVLQRRLRVLIVDEFQDVDPVQKEIAYLLGDPASGRADTTRLMLVGDPKQSIYRFRRADVAVWREVERDFEDGRLGHVVTLAENFRSVAPVLAFVDATVGAVLDRPINGERLQDFEVRFQPVTAARSDESPEPAVELMAVAAAEDAKPTADAIRSAEASAIAQRAVELHQSGVLWSEMALVLLTWSSLDRYESALRQAGVPTYALRGEGFYERREILDLVLALEVLRDPRDDRALVGWLRSPFAGLRDETLLAIAWRSDQPYWDYLDVVDVGGRERALLDRAVALLHEHLPLRDRVPVDELLTQLLERSGYLAHLYALGRDGDQAIANVRKFLRIARQSPGQGIGDLLRALRERRARGDREGDARLYGTTEDVFTITSVHSAKGLEWRVVFWGDMSRAPQRFAGNILIGRDRLAVKDPELDGESQPLHWRRLLQDEEAEQWAERKRLWYVAATRAKDRLVVSGLVLGKKESRTTGAAILESLGVEAVADGSRVAYAGRSGRRYECAVRVTPSGADGRTPDADERETADMEFTPRALPAIPPVLVAPAGRTRHSATELVSHTRCPRRHWLRYAVGLAEYPAARPGCEIASSVRGQIVHDVLAQLTADAEYDTLLDAAIGRWEPDSPAPEGAAAELSAARRRARFAAEAAAIEAVARHPDYRAVADLPTARRELAFLHILRPDCFTEGRIDLVACDGGGLVALDVKTGTREPEHARRMAEAYRLQRAIYAGALAAISGLPVRRFGFHFAEAGMQVSETFDQEAIARARLEVGSLLAQLEEGKPSLTDDPSHCRSCGYRDSGWCEGLPAR